MNDEQKMKLALDAFKKKDIEYPCSICKHHIRNVALTNLFIGIDKIENDRVINSIPIILISCDNCGYMDMYDTRLLCDLKEDTN